MKNHHPWNFIRNLGRDVFNTLFPVYCPICGTRMLTTEHIICAACMIKLPRTNYKGRRGNPIELFFADISERFVRANSYIYYSRGSVYSQPIFEFKYYNQPQVAVRFGELMADDTQESGFFNDIDAIVPIPLTPKRQRQRGYNQSYMLALGIAKRTGLPIITQAVVRTKFRQTQTHLDKDERQANVKDAFAIVKPDLLRGKHILLVDDIVTYGFTLRSCISKILEVEGTHVSIMTLGTAHKAFEWKPGI